MNEMHHFPYGGAKHRIVRAYISIALTTVFGIAVILWWIARLAAALLTDQPLSSLALDALVLTGLGAYLLWTSFLSLCNVIVTTASITVSSDQLVLTMVHGWTSHAPLKAVNGEAAIRVIYRLGLRRSLLRIRQQPPPALFVPVDDLTGHALIFRRVARMYVGRTAHFGILITPDHAQHEVLRARLSIRKEENHE